ncbi:hypothetical protein, partial [Streptosporangium minutum]
MKAYLGNRIGLAVTGAVLTGAGLYAFLRGHGKLPQPRGDRILNRGIPGYLAEHPLVGWLAALLLMALTLVAIRWLLGA